MNDSHLRQLRETWLKIAEDSKDVDVIPLFKKSLETWKPDILLDEVGTCVSVADGIARVEGLPSAFYGEILIFNSSVSGMVLDLKKDFLSCILFDDDSKISQGVNVYRTGKVAGVAVGDGYLSRVVDALGRPLDDGGEIFADGYQPIESPAPSIIERRSVNRPLETGILVIDSMFPIAKGQRQLIIGDRKTGKTSIALDTIINQRGKGVVCIYVAIGQKASSVAQIVETLRKHDALAYTIIVSASAADSPSLQYIAPYAGCAMGEYFMNSGRDVLIIYDDLSKHAVAYRTISLLLGRSPGREAYPGDVFYLHSRLLERAAQLAENKGGGSMTALPIVETQLADVSAYIPTNIISITDGQLFLESELFFSGQRPAVNIGLSVSRVGSDAQTRAMKRATGSLRLDLAQYHEMEVFSQFSSELDEKTRRQLSYGQTLMELLKQPLYHPLKSYEEVILLVAAANRVFETLPLDKIAEFKSALPAFIKRREIFICQEIKRKGELSDELRAKIVELSREFLEGFLETSKNSSNKK